MSLFRIFKTAMFTPFDNGRWGLPLCFEGAPGIGKSAIIEQSSTQLGLNCYTLTASDRDPVDFSGLPFANLDEGVVTRLVEDWLGEVFTWEHGVVFIDELSTIPGVVQAVLLRAIRSGVFAGRETPKGVRFIAAMNPSEIAAGGHKISQPLANRFGWLDFPAPTPDEWSEYMMRSGPDATVEPIDAEAEMARVEAAWPEQYALSVGLFTSAVKKLPHLLFNKPQNHDPQASKAWTSPRTLSYATRATAAARVHGLSAREEDLLIQGFVGEATAVELLAYQRAADLPDPGEVLDGQVKFKHNKNRLDKTWAVLNACTTLVTSPKCSNQQARATKMWEILDDVAGDAQDIVAAPCRAMLKSGMAKGQPQAFKVLQKIAPMLDAAGINWQDQK